ncbi:unnamed protein product, partial [Ixodes pacificus]
MNGSPSDQSRSEGTRGARARPWWRAVRGISCLGSGRLASGASALLRARLHRWRCWCPVDGSARAGGHRQTGVRVRQAEASAEEPAASVAQPPAGDGAAEEQSSEPPRRSPADVRSA